jgi:hypothetical protein
MEHRETSLTQTFLELHLVAGHCSIPHASRFMICTMRGRLRKVRKQELDFAHCGARELELGLRRLALNSIFPLRLPPEMPLSRRLSAELSDQGA